MECKNLIIITGMSCQGKTYIATELQKRYGFYVIYTDWFYSPLEGKPLECRVGEEDEEKSRLIRKQKPFLTETTIIDGSHIGNKKELEIFVRELGFDGNVYAFAVESPNLRKRFESKYKEHAEENWEGITKWFKEIYDLENAITVESAEDIINFLKIENGNICLSG